MSVSTRLQAMQPAAPGVALRGVRSARAASSPVRAASSTKAMRTTTLTGPSGS